MDAKVMEVLQGEEEVLEIHERCLEDADKRAQLLEVEKRALEEKVEKLEVEGQELRARLEAGAKHYRLDQKFSILTSLTLVTRKLAAAKEKLEKQQGEGERVAALEEQVGVLSGDRVGLQSTQLLSFNFEKYSDSHCKLRQEL